MNTVEPLTEKQLKEREEYVKTQNSKGTRGNTGTKK